MRDEKQENYDQLTGVNRMKVDAIKLAEAIKAEVGEMYYGAHDGVQFAIGKVEVKKGIFAQIQIKITCDNGELLAEPEWHRKCIQS